MHIAELFFTCPTTRQKMPTGIETDVRGPRRTPFVVEVVEAEITASVCGGGQRLHDGTA
jgi:hypothetical protein